MLRLLFEKLDRNIVNDLVSSKTEEAWTFLHQLCRNNDKIPFIELFKLLFEKLDQNIVNNLLLSKTSEAWTFLHQLCGYNDKTPFNELLELLIEKLDRNVTVELLLSKDTCEWTFLHQLCQYNEKTPLKKLLKLLFEKLDHDVIKELLISKTSNGWTILHFIFWQNDDNNYPIIELLDLLYEKFDHFTLTELCFSRTADGNTMYHLICAASSKRVLESLIHFSTKYFGILETENEITLKNVKNATCLLILSESNKRFKVLEMLKILLSHFNKTFVLKLLQAVTNDENDSVFTLINKRTNSCSILELLNFLKTTFGNSELKSLLSLQNKNKKSFVDQVKSFRDEDLLSQVVVFIKSLD